MPELKEIQLAGFNIAVVIAAVLCLCFMNGGMAADSSRDVIELQNKINPNDATAASLARLPGIGVTRANAIVEYRRQFQQNGRGDLAFRDCNDLRKIKGIGPVTAEKMCESLRF